MTRRLAALAQADTVHVQVAALGAPVRALEASNAPNDSRERLDSVLGGCLGCVFCGEGGDTCKKVGGNGNQKETT